MLYNMIHIRKKNFMNIFLPKDKAAAQSHKRKRDEYTVIANIAFTIEISYSIILVICSAMSAFCFALSQPPTDGRRNSHIFITVGNKK